MAASAGMHSYKTMLFVAPFAGTDPAGAAIAEGGTGTLTQVLAATDVYAEVAEIFSINGVPMNASVTRLTHLTSPGKAHEKIPGITDAGQVTFGMNFRPDLIAELSAFLPDDTDIAPTWGRFMWIVQFPTGGAQWVLKGFLQGMPFEVPEDDRITVEGTIEISGRPVFYE